MEEKKEVSIDEIMDLLYQEKYGKSISITKKTVDGIDENIQKKEIADYKNKKKIELKEKALKVIVLTFGTIAIFSSMFALKNKSKDKDKSNTNDYALVRTDPNLISTSNIVLVENNYDSIRKYEENINKQEQKSNETKEIVDFNKKIEQETKENMTTIEDHAVRIGEESDYDKALSKLTEEDKKLYRKYSEMYGVPSSLLFAMAYQESSFNPNYESGYAKGLFSIENTMIDGNKWNVKNRITNDIDTVILTNEGRKDKEESIMYASVILRSYYDYYSQKNINVDPWKIATLAWNFGFKATNDILSSVEQKGIIIKSFDDLKESIYEYSNLNKSQSGGEYGDKNYVYKIYNNIDTIGYEDEKIILEASFSNENLKTY